ncbi:hypothetical protein [Hydrogenophaga sp.]|uniref:hypothetical protein n=1 Tax=Hydrogenophaga sp. TaxID=1904254 RepID=UPI0025C262C2|nr:hypothetical protein [Hydrogenophaga sp.]
MESLDAIFLNTAVPATAAALAVAPLSTKVVLSSYMLPVAVAVAVAVFLPVGGWLTPSSLVAERSDGGPR